MEFHWTSTEALIVAHCAMQCFPYCQHSFSVFSGCTERETTCQTKWVSVVSVHVFVFRCVDREGKILISQCILNI